MSSLVKVALTLGLLLLSVACDGKAEPLMIPASPTPPPEFLIIGLSSSAAVLPDLVTAPYQQQTDRAVPQFYPANQQTLYRDLSAGVMEAILVHHILAGSEDWFTPVALDGLTVIVDPTNPIQALSSAQIQGVFTGRTKNWLELGGPDLPITLLGREPGSGAGAIFGDRVMAGQPLAANTRIASGDGAMRQAVRDNPGAIGYTMMAAAGNLTNLTIDGIAATPATVADQSYPLTVPLYFLTLAEPTGELRAFLAWAQSIAGQELLGEKYGRIQVEVRRMRDEG